MPITRSGISRYYRRRGGYSTTRYRPAARTNYRRRRVLRGIRRRIATRSYFPYNSSRAALVPQKGNPYGIETKSFDTNINDTIIQSGHTLVQHITPPDDGDSRSDRTGSEITVKGIVISLCFKNMCYAGDQGSTDGIVNAGALKGIEVVYGIVADMQPRGTESSGTATWPKAEDIWLQYDGDATFGYSNQVAPRNLNNSDRFKIIYERKIALQGTQATYMGASPATQRYIQGMDYRAVKFSVKIADWKQEFADGTQNYTAGTSLYVYVRAPVAALFNTKNENNVVKVNGTTRMRFVG